MPSIIIPSRYRKQPSYRPQIDWGHSLARGLATCVLANESSIVDLVNRGAVSTIGTPVRKGNTWSFNGSSSGADIAQGTLQYQSSTTAWVAVAAKWTPRVVSGTFPSIIRNSHSGGFGNFIVIYASGDPTTVWVDTGNASANAVSASGLKGIGVPVTLFAIKTGANTVASLWVNGVKQTTTNTGFIAQDADSNWHIAHRLLSGANDRFVGVDLEYFYVWDNQQQHSDWTARALYDNPYQFLRPIQNRLYFSLGGNVSVNITTQAATASAGSLIPAIDVPLSGLSATSATGTITPVIGVAVNLTGSVATMSVGNMTVATSVPLTGISGTGNLGTLIAAIDKALTGLGLTTSNGTLIPGTTVTLSGIPLTGSLGTLVASGGAGTTGAYTIQRINGVSTAYFHEGSVSRQTYTITEYGDGSADVVITTEVDADLRPSITKETYILTPH